ncbi:MAG TPA: inorganic diphosphatase [Gemmatimonadaceae bacterium]|nr:inorganic diphosphatase [Gemmatimonadaceae bacterium]
MPPFDRSTGDLDVVIDTPKGSRNKYAWNERLGRFSLSGVLPAGAVFPFDFGYVPGTRGGDGDPLDVLVLMDEPAFSGCHVLVRLVGVIEAAQTERDGETTRNDRLIGVASKSPTHGDVRTLADLNAHLIEQVEHFFVSYNAIKGKRFEVLGRGGPRRARTVVEQATLAPRRRRR